MEKSIFFIKYKTFIDEILAIVLSESIKVVYPPRRLRIPGNTKLEKQNTILHNIGHSWKTLPAFELADTKTKQLKAIKSGERLTSSLLSVYLKSLENPHANIAISFYHRSIPLRSRYS